GKPDWYKDARIEDYKVTSVWKIIKEDYQDWTFQLNGYALLSEYNKRPVKELQINAILKDWKKFEYEQKRGDGRYPAQAVAKVQIPLWSSLDTLQIILDKLKDHERLRDISDPETLYKLRPCTDEEKWHQKDSYAIIKNGSKRATKVYDNLQEAREDLA